LESRFLAERLRKLKEELENLKLEAYLCLHQANIHYFTGSPQAGETALGLLVTPDNTPTLFIPEMGAYQAQRQTRIKLEMEVFKVGDEALKRLRSRLKGFKVLGFDDASYARVSKLKVKGLSLKPHPEIPEKLRMVKDEGELEALRRAARILRRGFDAVLQVLKPGVREREVAAPAEYALRIGGSDFYAFPTLVASGSRSAYPHGSPTARRIREGDVVVVDLGARFSGYCVDATRTFMVGKVKPAVSKAYKAVSKAYKAAVEGVKPGMKGFEADMLARKVIQEWRFGGFFTHGLGHGVGLEVHEAPRLSPSSRDLLKVGSTFTLEPGIYLPGRFGVRVEDTVLLAEGGIKVLTGWSGKEFISLN
jgi:Xaa-Pro aminopeptidase